MGSKGGFSLIEVMCAILILGVALVGFTQAITTALGSSKDSELQTTAALFAVGKIETLRAEGFLADGATDGDCGNELPMYQWRQTIAGTSIKGLHHINVAVESTNSGKTIYELETLLFEAPASSDADESNNPKGRAKSKNRERRPR